MKRVRMASQARGQNILLYKIKLLYENCYDFSASKNWQNRPTWLKMTPYDIVACGSLIEFSKLVALPLRNLVQLTESLTGWTFKGVSAMISDIGAGEPASPGKIKCTRRSDSIWHTSKRKVEVLWHGGTQLGFLNTVVWNFF